ncbi:uncharacterized protein LOC132197798 isoform X3 [Neocloeon triangulifer]|uniref:uncharacterized protein LOC132197798 isoform X3 n=1 Tax=Neocloeon triangulifer TaxID=2078957 RepID=UPI00286F6472|nr:uncharacterized protein LOC132197798 isoform X3 [Neocloeon triangulifer]
MGRLFLLLFGIFAFLHFSGAAAMPDIDDSDNPECKDTEKIAEIAVGVKEFNDNGKKAFEAVHGQLTLVQSLLYLVVDKQETLEKRVECSPVGANVSNELQLLRQVSILTREKTDLAERAQESNKCCSEQVPQKDVEIKQLKEKVAKVTQEKTESEEHYEEELEKVKLALEKWENATSDELKKLAEEKHRAEIEALCKLSRTAELTKLSNGKKYAFSYPEHDWELTPADAATKCAEKGLHLATFRDEADLNAVVTAAADRTTYAWRWWVSAKNHGSGENYDVRWHDGSVLERKSPLWRFEGGTKEGCVYFHSGNDRRLNWSECRDHNYYVCELPTECY